MVTKTPTKKVIKKLASTLGVIHPNFDAITRVETAFYTALNNDPIISNMSKEEWIISVREALEMLLEGLTSFEKDS